MKQIELQNITDKAFKDTEADVIMVFFSEEQGVKVVPMWEYSCEFETAEEMREAVEKDFVTQMIKFADETGGGNILGAYALEWDSSDKE